MFHLRTLSSFPKISTDMAITKKQRDLKAGEMKRSSEWHSLEKLYAFENPRLEIDFLSRHRDIVRALPTLAEFIQKSFNKNIRLTLDLMDEGEDWQTLFINVYAHCDWEKCRSFSDEFYEYLFDTFPIESKKLNVSITV